jgi:hypothetical protein
MLDDVDIMVAGALAWNGSWSKSALLLSLIFCLFSAAGARHNPSDLESGGGTNVEARNDCRSRVGGTGAIID